MTKAKSAFYETTGPITYQDVPFIVVAENPDPGVRDIRIYDMNVGLPDGRTLLKGVNLHFRAGDRVIVTGESGSGKTTAIKAVMGNWDWGSGLVVMPQGVRSMLFSQQAYMPNATLRTILNMSMEGKEKFTDRELRKALQNVGLPQLVQQIPGQQVELLIDAMIDGMPPIARGGDDDIFNGMTADLDGLVSGMFSAVQFVPPEQKKYLAERLDEMLRKSKVIKTTPELENLVDRIAERIDHALVKPLEDKLARFAEDLSERKNGKVFSYTPQKVNYFCAVMKRKLNRKFMDYLNKEDTDDAFREIRLNETQVKYLSDSMVGHMRRNMQEKASSSPMHHIFNGLSWPVSLQALRVKANSAATDTVEATRFFMKRQVTTGDTLTLSGGERQKLMMAVARLHKPDILFLDEITSALDREGGVRQYQEMMNDLPKDTIVVSIAHNLHIMGSHNLHVHLKDQGVIVRRVEPAASGPTPAPAA